jgi:hypothetical protein
MLFEPDQWRAAIILHKKATLGGFVALKGNGEPGVKTFRPGLQRVMDFAAGIRYVRKIAHE